MTNPFLESMSIHSSLRISPGSAKVSFSVCRNVAILWLLQAAINRSSSFSSGIKGIHANFLIKDRKLSCPSFHNG